MIPDVQFRSHRRSQSALPAFGGRIACLGLAFGMVLSARTAPVISEFLARNRSALADGYGQYSDWIELHNPDAVEVDLGGHFLTDDPGELDKWMIPEITLAAGDYVVLYASGLNGLDPAGHWHTNFRLDGDGDYLALVAPDGETVLSQFPGSGGRFPSQFDDVSYGRQQRSPVLSLIDELTPFRVLVPNAGSWNEDWRGHTEPHDDSAWLEAHGAVGYELGTSGTLHPLAYWPEDVIENESTPDLVGNRPLRLVDVELARGAHGNALRFDGEDDYAVIDAFPELRSPASFTISLWFNRTVDHAGESQDSNHAVNNILLAHSASSQNDNVEIGTEGGNLEFYFDTTEQDGPSPSLRVPAGILNGRWYHLVLTYDQARASQVAVFLNGSLLGEFDGWGGGFDISDAPLTLGIARPDRELWADFEGLIDDVAIWQEALNPAEVRTIYQGVPPTSLGGLAGAIVTDIADIMHGQGGSLLARIPFEVEDPARLSQLTLGLRYDAGFVAWLNGTEIERANAPPTPEWFSVATAERDDEEALAWVDLALEPPGAWLRSGRNVLALHGLNSAADDEDFLLEARLEAVSNEAEEEVFFATPTPGAPNEAGLLGFVSPVQFSVQRGFYETPFAVELWSPTFGAEIRYTTNGSAPTKSAGTRYTEPVAIGTTTVLRAAAFREGYGAAPAVAHSYVFIEDVLQQPENPPGFPNTWTTRDADYAMDPRIVDDAQYAPRIREALRSHPTISLAMDVDDLFDPTTGIYSNSQSSGDAWERPVSVELFDFPHGQTMQVNAGLRMQGNASRAPTRPKHNMRLAFRRMYGPGSLHFPLFSGVEADEFNNLVLRGQNGDSWVHPNANQRERAQYIRDQWHRDMQVAMGHRTLNQGHFHLYLNGLYWGFFHVFDRAEAEFMAANFGGDETDYDVVQDYNRAPGQVEAIDGDLEAWDAMVATAAAAPDDPATLPALHQYLDLENFVDYLLLNFYSGNTDWDASNWRAGRRRGPGEGYRFFAWDSERTVGDSGQANLVTNTDVTTRDVANRATGLHQMLTANPEYRLFFADRAQRHCFGEGALTPAKAATSWLARVDEIRLPLVAEAARWGDTHRPSEPYDPEDEWMAEVNRLMSGYFPVRTGILLNQLRARWLYPSVAPPTFLLPGDPLRVGDRIRLEHPLDPRVEVFFTLDGSDPRQPGGQPSASASGGREAVLLTPGILKARARNGDEWSALVEHVFDLEDAEVFQAAYARGSGDPHGLLLYFTRPVDPATATDVDNYVLVGQPVAALESTLLEPRTVLLRVSEYGPQPLVLRMAGIREQGGDAEIEEAGLPVDLGGYAPEDYIPLVFESEPRDMVLLEGQPLSWEVALTGAPQPAVRLRWRASDGQTVFPASESWDWEPAQLTDDGVAVHAEAFYENGVFSAITSREATLRVLPDLLPPALTAVEARAGAGRIILRFSEPLEPTSATAPGNHVLTGSQIIGIELEADGRGVVLLTPPLTEGQALTLQLRDLADRSAAGNRLTTELAFQPLAPGYRERVLQSEPVRYWRFEETAGTSLASEGTEMDSAPTATASAINGVSLAQPGLIPGDPTGLALAFNGVASQRLNVPNGADLNITAAPWSKKTVELWFRAQQLPAVVEGTPQVATLYEQGAGTRALALYLYGASDAVQPETADLVWFAFNNATGDGPGDGWGPALGNAVFVTTPVELGRLYHVIGVMDGDDTDALRGQLRLYLNGVQVGAAAGVGQLYAHSGDIRVGQGDFRWHDNRSGETGYFTGVLDELALYNRALSGPEVAAHFAAALTTPEGHELPPHLALARVEDYLVLDFSGVLEAATSISGPWIQFASASPHLLPFSSDGSAPKLFMRARRVDGR